MIVGPGNLRPKCRKRISQRNWKVPFFERVDPRRLAQISRTAMLDRGEKPRHRNYVQLDHWPQGTDENRRRLLNVEKARHC